MSYDFYVQCGTCESTTFDANITSNVAKMWRAAGIDFLDYNEKPVWEMIHALREAVKDMEEWPSKYEAMNPENGWGSFPVCLEFMRNILAACEKNPMAKLSVNH